MVTPVPINDTQFDALVLKASVPVLLECASPECIICKTMAERIREASRDVGARMIFLRLNVNESRRWQEYDVRVIPTLLYFKGGALVARQDTFPDTEDIRAKIKELTAPGAGTKRPR
ncbi:MAG: thioredoxin family protein [Deltaproteobacteria bacterium]